MQRKRHKAQLDEPVRDGLLEKIPHDRARGRCAEYRVSDAIMTEYNRLIRRHVEGVLVNLFTSKPTTRKHRSKVTDDNNNALPDLVKTAIRAIDVGYCNEPAVLDHLAALKSDYQDARAVREQLDLDEKSGTDAYEAALAKERVALNRYTHDLACYETMKKQKTRQISPSVFEYQTAYRMQMSGRLAQIGGGAQSASRQMKEAIYTGIDDLHNYDIKSSQVYVLIEQLTRARIEAGWLRTYASTPDAKHVYAAKAGISVDSWKSILYALFMGATLPKNITSSDGVVRNTLEAEAGQDRLEAAYSRLRGILEPLYRDALKLWRTYLLDSWLELKAYRGHAGRRYVKNAVGVRFCVDDVANPYELKKKLAAFLLQGREAAFIHTLTGYADEYGFQVISNEHDGLVTIGSIPTEAINRAKRVQDMDYVRFVEKSFC